jgi:predicted RNA-binding protein with PIN domain
LVSADDDPDTARAADDRAVAALTEPARQRLVAIASDVLGRMSAEDVPTALRAIAKFTPAKRARLGGAALLAALDVDVDFRERLGEVIAQASPQLADAIRAGGSTAASDPIDIAVVAYLTRPDGWVEVLTDANARWAEQRDAASVHARVAMTLRAELVEARARLKAEPARVREAISTSAAGINAEVAQLRRQLRERTQQLREMERARDEAVAAVGDSQDRIDAITSSLEAELRRARARISELERAASATRREARNDRDVDDARLWLLADTLAEAAAGIRRELALGPPTVRPADLVSSAATSGRTRRVDDPASIDRLLGLPNVHLIVDGYNVTKTGYADLPLADQRVRLIGSMATLAARSGAELTVAFDGGTKPPAQPRTARGVRVLFSAADEIADDLIRRLVAQEPQGRPIVVVTSDEQVVSDVLRAGAWTVPSAVFLARLG